MRYFTIILFVIGMLPLQAQEKKINTPVVNGVSWELATYRKNSISNINYDIELHIPALMEEPIKSEQVISFDLNNILDHLQIDFKEDDAKIERVTVNGTSREINHYNEHIVIAKNHLKIGKNEIEIRYTAGDGALNRNDNYLYTLFVPDRMRTSFPSFDQPNLKATFDLTLIIPRVWKTISSAPIKKRDDREFRSTVEFERSDLMSTYLFSFVAGGFEEIIRDVDGVEMTMLHRETDATKVAQNVDEIFNLHKASLDYMEEYTGIKFPFKKFGFALIPSFQFGGMEHVGAIQYKARTLMLDNSPPKMDLMARAALIGHETSHMWFGDLVTMDWFNDVWTKEVFATFMSSKLVNPIFPEINHDLRAHLRRHPGAYSVDRSEGPNAIRQVLSNLNEAGSMYGAIIYAKAPIMMNQLEKMLGKNNFRDGIREYLKKYAFSNATWPNLIEILDKRSERDLKAWSEVWVNTPGRPTFNVSNDNNKLILSQVDPLNMERQWPQQFNAKNGGDAFDVSFSSGNLEIGSNANDSLLLNSNGMGYGLFPVDKNLIKEKWDTLEDLERASIFVNLYEQLVEGNETISPMEYVELIRWTVEREKNQLIIRHLMSQLLSVYWSLLSPEDRMEVSPAVEDTLWQAITLENRSKGERKMIFKAYANITQTQEGLSKIKDIWSQTMTVNGLELSIRDYTELATMLAIKLPDEANGIIMAQANRIKSPDKLRRFNFIRMAASPDQQVRDDFFELLKNEENRATESWVLTALSFLHHPLRVEQSEKYITPSLELLQEIQITGDIFFPARWSSATLKYYQSSSAVKQVRDFLAKKTDYNKQLKMKILQGADQMFRANRILTRADYKFKASQQVTFY